MENVCHTLFGAALARAGLGRLSPLAGPATVVAANFPDVDVVTMLGNPLWYLEHHRGITHSALGILVSAPIVAGGFMLFDRLWRRRRDPSAEPARFAGLATAALVGLLSHLLLDWTNSYGVKPWLPFDSSWYYGDLVFVVDPWLWLVLGGALFVGASRRLAVSLAWGATFAVMSLAVAAAGLAGMRGGIGTMPVLVWFAGLAAVALMRVKWRPAPSRGLAASALAVTAAYWCALALAHHLALIPATARAGEVPGTRVEDVAAVPTPMRPDRWRALIATDTHIETGDVTIVDIEERYARRALLERNVSDPAVRAALGTCPGQVAAAFNRFLYAEVAPGPDGSTTVLLKDARFGDLAGSSGFSTTPVELDGGLEPARDDRACPAVGWNR